MRKGNISFMRCFFTNFAGLPVTSQVEGTLFTTIPSASVGSFLCKNTYFFWQNET